MDMPASNVDSIMKKAVLTLGASFIFAGIFAQIGNELGVKTGLNLSTQRTGGAATNVETNWKPGFHIGIYGCLFYTEKLAGQLEILYSQKGSVWSDPDYSGKEVVTYIDVPLTARFQVLDLLNIQAGPQFSLFTGAWRIPDDGIYTSVSKYYDQVDVGLVVGAELNLPSKLNLAVRFIEGLMVTTDSRFYTDPWKNRVFELSLSYAVWRE
jgi:Outer membrane protein beta-barrel domain